MFFILKVILYILVIIASFGIGSYIGYTNGLDDAMEYGFKEDDFYENK